MPPTVTQVYWLQMTLTVSSPKSAMTEIGRIPRHSMRSG